MSKKNCPVGHKWDSLLQTCMPLNIQRNHPIPAEPSLATLVRVKNTPPAEHTAAALNPALWIIVLVATLGSVLALALWLLTCKRPSRQHIEEEPAEQRLHKTGLTVPARCQRHSGASPQSQRHPHPGRPPVWQEDAPCEQMGHDAAGNGGGLQGNAVQQETVPLLATKLVTTKTL